MMATNSATLYPYLIIGSGRVARHLGHYFHLLQIPFQTWDRSQDPHALQRKIASSSRVLLAISDSAIEGFYRQHLQGHDIPVVHFSGAHNFTNLLAAHPLMTFSEELYSLDFYKRIHFTLTGATELAQVLPGLNNPYSLLPLEDKALYHAYCVAGGNFVSLLMLEMIRGFAQLNVPQEAAQVYLEKVFENTVNGQQKALTGPLIRKDNNTVDANLNALRDHRLYGIYQSFIKAYWPEYPRK